MPNSFSIWHYNHYPGLYISEVRLLNTVEFNIWIQSVMRQIKLDGISGIRNLAIFTIRASLTPTGMALQQRDYYIDDIFTYVLRCQNLYIIYLQYEAKAAMTNNKISIVMSIKIYNELNYHSYSIIEHKWLNNYQNYNL